MSIYGIPQSTLYRWLKDYRQFVERLRIENSLLKSAKCSVQAPLSVKLPEMIRLQKETNCSVYMLCKAFDVRKSTYYHRVLRSPDVTQHEAEDEALKSVVKTVFDESKGRFGSAMIKAKMDERGYQVSPKRIARLMREMSLQCSRNKPTLAEYKRTYIKSIYYTGNKLKSKFTQTEPNKAWVSDTTFLRTIEGVCFLCVIIDLFSRRVIGHFLSQKEDINLSCSTLDIAIRDRIFSTDLIFHSDQGSIYTAKDYMDKLKSLGITQSFSRTAMPYDNAVAESFFASMKKEEIYQHIYKDYSELSVAVDEYICFYNSERPHYTLGMKTPCQIEASYYGNQDK